MQTPAIETVDIGRLKPDPLNPRQMSPTALADLQRSLRQFGFVQPVVARRSDGLVIGGHQRLKAAQAEGWTKVPVCWWEGSDNEARALNLALNKISGDWDERQLATILAELAAVESLQEALLGFDTTWTSLAGFNEREVLQALDAELGRKGQGRGRQAAGAVPCGPQRRRPRAHGAGRAQRRGGGDG